MGLYLYTIFALICTFYLTNAQTKARENRYQIYWYVATGDRCQRSEKFSNFKSAYNLYKFTQYYRQPVMIVNDPYVFNR